MRRLSVQIALVAVMSTWLGVFVPGHQRHWVALPGADSHHHHDHEAPAQQHDESHCAVCLFARTMSVPADVTPGIASLEPVDLRLAIESSDLVAMEMIPTFHGRAPPAVVFG